MSRRRAISPVRALAITTGAILFADIVAMGVLEVLKLQGFFAMTMLDAVIMAALVFPLLFGLAFRPMMRLIQTQAATEQELAQVNVELRAQIAERERAQEALQRYAKTQEALYAVAVAATHQLDVAKLTAQVTEVVLRLFAADAGWVLFPGSTQDEKPQVAFAREAPEALIAAECSESLVDCSTCGPWFRDGFPPTASPIVTSCPRLPQEVLSAAGFASHVGLMLRAGTRVLGTLNLAWRTPRAHSEAEQSLLVTIAGQVGFALENALLYRAEQRARQTAEAIRAASLAVTQTLDLDKVLETLLENLRLLVTYDRARVMLVEGASRLRVEAAFVDGQTRFLRERPITFDPATNPVINNVLTTLRGTLIPDIHTHPEWGGRMRAEFDHSSDGRPAGRRRQGHRALLALQDRARLLLRGGPAAGRGALCPRLGRDPERRSVQGGAGRQRAAADALEEAGRAAGGRAPEGLARTPRRGGPGTHLVAVHPPPPRARGGAGAARSTARTEDLRRLADSVQETLHRVATDLRPVALDHLGLVPALQQLVGNLSTSGGPSVVLETVGLGDRRLTPDVETALYRIAQEAVTNAVRHAGARDIAVVLERREGHVVLIIEDDGRGFDADLASRSGRLGMIGMRERAEMLGGRLLMESSPGSGTTIVVEVPHDR